MKTIKYNTSLYQYYTNIFAIMTQGKDVFQIMQPEMGTILLYKN